MILSTPHAIDDMILATLKTINEIILAALNTTNKTILAQLQNFPKSVDSSNGLVTIKLPSCDLHAHLLELSERGDGHTK